MQELVRLTWDFNISFSMPCASFSMLDGPSGTIYTTYYGARSRWTNQQQILYVSHWTQDRTRRQDTWFSWREPSPLPSFFHFFILLSFLSLRPLILTFFPCFYDLLSFSFLTFFPLVFSFHFLVSFLSFFNFPSFLSVPFLISRTICTILHYNIFFGRCYDFIWY